MNGRYAKANLFVGTCVIPLDGHIKLTDDVKLLSARGTVTEDGWVHDGNGDPWLLVASKGFFYVMIKLDEDQFLEPWDGVKRLIEVYDLRYDQ